MPPTTQQPTDQQALALTHAIALQESGRNGTPNYNAVGDAGTSKGAYQWQPGNFESAAKNAGLDPSDFSPENQDKVAYSEVKAYKDKGYDPGQIASLWNSGSPNNWQNHAGTTTINGKTISYDTPAYVKGVQKYYQQITGGNSQPPTNGLPSASAAPKPLLPASQDLQSATPNTSNDPSGGFISGLAEDATGTNPDSIDTQVENTVKGVGNFLFPAVGDIYNDVTGQNKKTALQQAGDVGLSVLPFIPGLGEAGEYARGAELAGEAGADAVKGGGLLSKVASLPTAVKGAGVGYGAGVASNLSQGQSLGQAVTPNAATIGGAVLGGAAPLALKGLGGIATKAAGIDPQIETKLTQLGVEGNSENATLYDQYMQAAKAHATNGEVPAPENMAADNIDQASAKIDQMASQASKEVGAANKAAANVPIDPQKIPAIATALNERLDSFGYKVGTADDGTLSLVPTRSSAIPLSASDKSRVLEVANRINDMGNGGNVRTADDLMTLLDMKHPDYAMSPDPLNAIFGQTRHDVNEVARKASPEFGAANDKLAKLRGLQDTIKTIAGDRLQRGELLMQRMFGKNPGDSQALFSAIKDATGVDLYKHAVLARHAIESVGSKADKSALQQMIEGSTKGHVGLLGAAGNIARGMAKKTFANPETIGRNLVKGKSKGLLEKAAVKIGARVGASL